MTDTIRYKKYKERRVQVEQELVMFFKSRSANSFALRQNFSLHKEVGEDHCFVYWKSWKLGKIIKVDLTAVESHLVKEFVECKYEFIADWCFESRFKKIFPSETSFVSISLSLGDLVATVLGYYWHNLESYGQNIFASDPVEVPF